MGFEIRQFGLETPLWPCSSKVTWGKLLHLPEPETSSFVKLDYTPNSGLLCCLNDPFPWHPSLIQTFWSTYLPSAVNTQLFTALSWMMSSASLALILIASYGFQVYRSSPELSPDAQTHSLNFPLESSTWIFCIHLKFKSFNSSRKSSVPPF